MLYRWNKWQYKTAKALRAAIRKSYPGRVSLGVSELHVSFGDGSVAVFDLSREEKAYVVNGSERKYGVLVCCDLPKTTIPDNQ